MPRVAKLFAQLCGVAVVLVVGWVAGSALDHRTGTSRKAPKVAQAPTRSLPSLRVLAEFEPWPRAAPTRASGSKQRSGRRSSRASRRDRARSSRGSRNRVSRSSARRVTRRSIRRREASRPAATPAPPVVQPAPPVVQQAPAPAPPAPAPPAPAPPAPPPPAPSPAPAPSSAPKSAAPSAPSKPPAAVAFDDSA